MASTLQRISQRNRELSTHATQTRKSKFCDAVGAVARARVVAVDRSLSPLHGFAESAGLAASATLAEIATLAEFEDTHSLEGGANQ